jgi:hypothetical protein
MQACAKRRARLGYGLDMAWIRLGQMLAEECEILCSAGGKFGNKLSV